MRISAWRSDVCSSDLDDAGECGICRRLGALDLRRAVAVECAGEGRGVGLLRDGHALAGNLRLVDAAGAGHDTPVKGDAFAWSHDEVRADGHLGGGELAFLAVIGSGAHGRWGEVEEGGDGAPRTSDAPALEGEGQRKEEGDGRRLEQFADADCANHRSEEHTSELPSLLRTSYAAFCWKKKTYFSIQ